MTSSQQLRPLQFSSWPSVRDEPLFDVLTATADDIQGWLKAGKFSTKEVVSEYLRQIKQHNGYLNGVSQIAQDVLKDAEAADEQRKAGKNLGPLQGIPLLLKVTYLWLSLILPD